MSKSRDYPDCLAVLNTFGELNLVRLPFALSYYFLGTSWFIELRPLFSSIRHLYDGIEGPSSAFVLTATVPLLLAVSGFRSVFRRQTLWRSRTLIAGVLVSELVGIGFLLAADYLAMRYRMDFIPVLSFAAALGYFVLTTGPAIPRRTIVGALLLTAVSIFASHLGLVQYKEESKPVKEEAAEYFWERYQCAKDPGKCPR